VNRRSTVGFTPTVRRSGVQLEWWTRGRQGPNNVAEGGVVAWVGRAVTVTVRWASLLLCTRLRVERYVLYRPAASSSHQSVNWQSRETRTFSIGAPARRWMRRDTLARQAEIARHLGLARLKREGLQVRCCALEKRNPATEKPSREWLTSAAGRPAELGRS
jgi:hypothetical protein